MAKRTPIFIGNWKMNLTMHEALRLLTELKSYLSGKLEVEVVVAPDMACLHSVCIALQDEKIAVAAQNMHWELHGAHTGEVSAPMLVDIGCTHVIIGHSERRQQFHESDRDVRLKYITAIEQDLIPIVCVGETFEQHQKGQTLEVIEAQLAAIFQGTELIHASNLILAYEPVWAIGTGKNATPQQAETVQAHMRQQFGRLFRSDLAQAVRIVYGGSVTPNNARALMQMPEIDGLLVGGSSLNPKDFAQIVHCDEHGDDGEGE